MMRKCPVCSGEYSDGGDSWKFCCYSCYKDYGFLINKYEYPKARPIKRFGFKSDVYLSHPSIDKDDMNEFLTAKKLDRGWGPEEWDASKWSTRYKIWIVNVNYD